MNCYDFDKTIYNGDSTFHFYFYCLKHYPRIIKWLFYQGWVFFLYVIGFYNKTQFKERFYKFFKSIDNIELVVERFWDEKIVNIKQWYLDNKRDDDIIISASPEFLLRPICRRLGIKKLIASKVDCKSGKYTGLNCWGEEKVKRFYAEYPNGEFTRFYSDSLSDTPLANLASNCSYIVIDDTLIPWNEYKVVGFNKIKKMFLSIEFISFLMVGFINTFNGVLFSYLYSLLPFFNANTAFVAGYVTSLTISYFLNTYITFHSKAEFIKYIKYAASYIPNFVIQNIIVYVVYNCMAMPSIIAYALAGIIGVPITFLMMKIFVFSKKTDR